MSWVRWVLHGMLALVVVSLVSGMWTHTAVVGQTARDAEVVNLGGRQRMLAVRMALLAIDREASIGAARIAATSRMMDVADQMEREFGELRARVESMGQANEDRALRRALASLDATRKDRDRVVAAARVLKAGRLKPDGERAMLAELRSASESLLWRSERAVSRVEELLEARVAWLIRWELVLGSVLVAIVGLLGLFVVEPVIRGLARERGRLLSRAEELERLSLVARRTTNAVVMTDVARRVTWVNDGFTRISGHQPEEAIGKSPGALLQCEETDQKVVEQIRLCLGAGEPFRGEILNQAKDGRRYWLDLDIQPLRDASGKLTGFVAIESDVTTQVQQRLVLEDLNDRFQAAVEGTSDGLWDWRVSTGEVWYAGRFWELLGFHGWMRLPEPTLDAWLARVHPEDVEALRSALLERARGVDEPMMVECRLLVEDVEGGSGYRWFRVRGVAQHGEHGGVVRVAGSIQDVEEQRRTAEELLLAREKAESASRSKSEFLANMSHEIRTPMTAILGFAEILAGEAEGGSGAELVARRREAAETIRRHGEHLLAIINDILDVSKIEAGKMAVESVPVSVERVVRDVLQLMAVKASGKGIELVGLVESEVPAVVISDAVRLRQVLVNLVGNAIKFTEVGSVRVSVRHEGAVAAGAGVTLRFAVLDTGIGMSPDQVERLFGAFEQADASTTRRFGGTGLGLRISKRLAEMMGGGIEVRSEAGKGSEFIATVRATVVPGADVLKPGLIATSGAMARAERRAAEECAAAMAKKSGAEGVLSGLRVLLAEDGPDNAKLVSFHLRKAGAEVVLAEHGGAALSKLTADGTTEGALMDPPPVDVVLTDMQMPVMDGYELARALRRKGWTGPIVALTAHAMAGDRDACVSAGCDGYASKPIEKERLIAACREAGVRAGWRPTGSAAGLAGGVVGGSRRAA